MGVVRNLMVRAGADFSPMTTEMKKAQASMETFREGMKESLKKMAEIFLEVFAVEKVIEFGKASVEAANEAAINETKLTTVMKQRMGANEEMIQSITKLAEEQQKLGVIATDAQIGGAQQLATFLHTTDALKALMPAMNNLAAQQFGTNATSEDMVNIGKAMGKVMDGNVGSLKRLGISFTEAEQNMIKYGTEQERAAALAKVIDNNVGQMNAALENTPQGRMKQLSNTMLSLKEAVGNGLLQVMQAVVPYLNIIANGLLRVAQSFSAFMSAIFGSAESQTNDIANQKAAMDALGDSYTTAANKAKNGVASFDQVHQLTEPIPAGGAGGADSSAEDKKGEGGKEGVSGKIKEMADKIKATLKDMSDFISSHKDIIIASLAGITAGLTTMLLVTNWEAIVKGLAQAFVWLDVSIEGAWAAITAPISLIIMGVALLVAAFVYFYRTNEGFRGFVDGILKAVGDMAVWLWKNVLVPLGKFLVEVFVESWKVLVKIVEWLWKNVLIPLGDFLLWFWNNVIVPLGKVLGEILGVAFTTLSTIATSFWKEVMIPLGDFFTKSFGPAVTALSAVLKVLWNDVFKPLAKFIGEVLKVVFTDLTDIIVFLWHKVFEPLVKFVGGALSDTFSTVFKTIGKVINDLQQTFTDIMGFITSVFEGDWEKAWNFVGKIFQDVFSTLYDFAKTPLNFIIDLVNDLIDGLNKISISIPNWVPLIGGKTFGVNIPHIPHLARGGFTNGETNMGNYIAGEAGTEMIVPLENTSFVNSLASALGTAVMNAMRFNGGDNKNGDTVMQLDGVTFARLINSYTAKEETRQGSPMISTSGKAVIVTS